MIDNMKTLSKEIWKFPINTTDIQSVNMPTGSQILCVQLQNGTPCLWAMVSPHMEPSERIIRVYGTGHPINENVKYIGSYQMNGGMLVFHVFEELL